jgi:hypothetical protein
MFIALNWPLQTGQRGEPNCTLPFGKTGTNGAPLTTVWQSYKFVDEIFLPHAQHPGPWNSTMPTQVHLSEIAKASKAANNSPIGAIMQPVGGWLIDQQGNPTFYQIAANEISYNYIVNNGLYNANTANSDSNIDFPWDTTEIKASWRVLTKAEDKTRYLTMDATIDTFDDKGNPTGTKAATLGLVGLHIINKAAGFPQWIWSTFEQVDNVVAPPNGKASYMNPNATPTEVNQSPCAGNAIPCKPRSGKTFHSPDPLTRMTPISAGTATVNGNAQNKYANTFAKYYQLVTTQWPADPNDPGNPAGTPTPNVAANVTMESYIQSTSSCMACHSTAVSGPARNRADFSFLFIHAQEP